MSNYFNKRLIELLKADIKRSKRLEKNIRSGYKLAKGLIEADIEKYTSRIADELELDLNKLNKKLSIEDMKVLAQSLGVSDDFYASYANLSYMEAIRLEMAKSIRKLADDNESLIYDHLAATFENNYYTTCYELYKTMDDFTFKKRVTTEYFDFLAKKPWTADGKTFSQKIWTNQERLINEMSREFVVSATRGANIKESAKRLSQRMDIDYKRCVRLLNTEDSFFSNQAVLEAYKNTTSEQYRILATLDSRTCDVCGSVDLKVFNIKDAKAGINLPPFHPNCRCTTTIYFEDDEESTERMMRDENGKSVKDKFMSYDEWKKKYVDKVDENSAKEGINKIEKGDKKEEVPATLKNFEKHSQEWEDEVVKKQLSEEQIKVINDYMKNIIDKNEFCMRRKPSTLEKIVKDGRFKNQFETNTSGGLLGAKERNRGANQLFGEGQELLKGHEREKYGYLGSSDYIEDANSLSLQQYGTCVIRFNKNKLLNRTTYTLDDSLGPAILEELTASNVNMPRANGISKYDLQKVYDLIKQKKVNNLNDLVRKTNSHYFELQYHGDLKIDDISEVCFTWDMPNEETIEILREKGIKLFRRIFEGGGEKIIEI